MLRKKKCTLGFLCVFLYKAGRSGLLRLPVFVPSILRFPAAALSPSSVSDLECQDVPRHATPPPQPLGTTARRVRPTRTGFKIDLYIFIYAYIKKKAGKFSQWCVGGEEMIP